MHDEFEDVSLSWYSSIRQSIRQSSEMEMVLESRRTPGQGQAQVLDCD